MKKSLSISSMVAGLISGVIIGVFFKVIEMKTNVKVYTLLLNIDFIPILNRIHFSESIEFIFHLIVSILLTLILYVIVIYFVREKYEIAMLIGLSVLVGIFIYPITNFSARTPHIFSVQAIFWWLLGHFLYGIILSVLFKFYKKNYT